MDSQTLSGGGLGKKRWEREWMVAMRDRRASEGESWPLIKRGFTEAQRKELAEQGVINRHISAGLPVPLHLVLPIWKSVVTSLGPSNPNIYKQYPSFIGFILQGFDCGNVMDSEPGRCRRTDGKKWRCSRDVLSDQKYCERHIHRGRHRSRKLVEEASQFASPSKPTKPQKPKREMLEKPNTNPSVSVGLQLMTSSSRDGNASCRNNINTTVTGGFSQKRISCVTVPFIPTGDSSGLISSSVEATNSSNAVKTGQDDPMERSEKRFGYNLVTRGGKSTNDNKVTVAVRNASTGFSPKSVLQVAGSKGLYTGIELEPGRCRRTDGKKWRCRREVVTDQKYCPRHMHRGAKKIPKPTLPPFSCPLSEGRASISTELCISVPTSPPPLSNDEKSVSTDTTLSDTSVSAYVISRSAS